MQKAPELHTAVLTHSGSLPDDHIMFSTCVGPILILCTNAMFSPSLLQLQQKFQGSVVIHHLPGANVKDALRFLRERVGVDRVSIEAGPATTSTLYSETPDVDMLLLSTYEGELNNALIGPRTGNYHLHQNAYVPASQLQSFTIPLSTVQRFSIESNFQQIGESVDAGWRFEIHLSRALCNRIL